MESLRKDAGRGDLNDLVAAVDYLKTTGYVDPKRIAIMGGSWGGYLTLMALTKTPEIWVAGVSIVPLANWFTAHENEDPVRSEEHTSELQSPCNLVCRLLLEKKK